MAIVKVSKAASEVIPLIEEAFDTFEEITPSGEEERTFRLTGHGVPEDDEYLTLFFDGRPTTLVGWKELDASWKDFMEGNYNKIKNANNT